MAPPSSIKCSWPPLGDPHQTAGSVGFESGKQKRGQSRSPGASWALQARSTWAAGTEPASRSAGAAGCPELRLSFLPSLREEGSQLTLGLSPLVGFGGKTARFCHRDRAHGSSTRGALRSDSRSSHRVLPKEQPCPSTWPVTQQS